MQQLISNEQHELFYYNNFRFSSYPHSCNRVYCFWSSSILFCIIPSTLPFQTVKCFAFIFRRNATHFYFIWCFFCKCHLTSFTVNVGIFKNKVLVAKYELFYNISMIGDLFTRNYYCNLWELHILYTKTIHNCSRVCLIHNLVWFALNLEKKFNQIQGIVSKFHFH